MDTFACYKSRLMPCILLGLLASGVCSAQEYRDMDLTVSLHVRTTYGKYWVDVQIVATMFWTPPPERIAHYVFYVDGYFFNIYGGGHNNGGGWIVQESFPVSDPAKMERWLQEYFNRRHTFRLIAEPPTHSLPKLYDEFIYIPPDVLRIENCVCDLPSTESHSVEVSHRQETLEGIDPYDVAYASTALRPTSTKIVSLVPDPNGETRHELQRDARPKDSTSDIHVELSLVSSSGEPINFASPARNELRFTLPGAPWDNDFPSQPITIQAYDPLDPLVQRPVYDVRKLIAKNAGVMPLPDLHDLYNSAEPYAHMRLSFTREASIDLTRDGRSDLRDFAVFANGWRLKDRPTIADIAGTKGLGMPDGRVDGRDLLVFCWEWAGHMERFESGAFDEFAWILAGSPPWRVVSSESHGGQYSARTGQVADGETCTLMISLDCVAGQISFWRKVSSERYSDFLRFRIDRQVMGEWSGELDWEKVSFPVSAGKRVFSWDYVKDASASSGTDAAWIDDIIFPHG